MRHFFITNLCLLILQDEYYLIKIKEYLDKYDKNLIRKILLSRPLGGVVTQRPAKPWTPVRIWQWPPYKFMDNTPLIQ